MTKKKTVEIKEEVKKEDIIETEVVTQVEKDLMKANKKIADLEAAQKESTPQPTTVQSSVILTAKARAMKEVLDKQDKVDLVIPLENKEKDGTQTITLNGYPYHIRKGVRVKVPAQIAEVYFDSVAVQSQAIATAQEKAGKVDGK